MPSGTKQQISLVASLLHDPEIVFLDEPTAGVSPAARALFWEFNTKNYRTGKTVFVTTHYMDEAEQCNRIALMRDGEIVALDTPLNLKKQSFPEQMYEFESKTPLSFRNEKIKITDRFFFFRTIWYKISCITKIKNRLGQKTHRI